MSTAENREPDMSAYGPQVPLGLKAAADSTTANNAVIGPVLPPGFKPSAPRDTGSSTDESSASSNEEAPDLYGPSLPPGFGKPDIIGPVLPPGFASSSSSSSSQSFIGPAMPPGFGKTLQADQEVPGDDDDDDSSDSYIGPKPSEAVGEDYAGNEAALDIDRRANKMKRHLEGKDQDDEPRREEWMTELPDNLGLRIGLGPRTFRKNMEDPKADRSQWTDTPADKAKKAEKKAKKDEAEPSRHPKRSKKEEEIAEQLTNYNKEKRAESLLDMHRKKRKVEQSKVVVQERREFNREEDLKISHIDAKANKALLNKAALLNTKFAAGAQKFL